MTFKPMKGDDADRSRLQFPYMITPKIDGYRCVVRGGVALTSSLKPFPNKYLQSVLGIPECEGFDGELVIGDPTDSAVFRNSGALRKVAGSVCAGCYAFKGNYAFPNVQAAQYRRLEALKDPRWVDAMVYLIKVTNMRFFRWHDSGDLQSPAHLGLLAEVAKRCRGVRFWLPTRERVFVYSWIKANGPLPSNLVVRVSAAMIDGAPPDFPNTSTVVTGAASCPAPNQGGECGTCRRCWNPRVKNVSYRKH